MPGRPFARRILIWSGNRASGTIQSYMINLPFTIKNLRRIEWISSSVVGYVLAFEGFSESITSSGTSYWRFLEAYQNWRVSDWVPNTLEDRRTNQSLTQVKFSFFNPDGSAATLTTEHVIELEVICDE